MNASPDARAQWIRRARAVALRVNFGFWLNAFLPWFCGISLLASAVILIARSRAWPLDPVWIGYGAALLVAAIVCIVAQRRSFHTTADGLIRLEAVLGLKNRLTAAEAGVGPWPEPAATRDGLRWRWPKIVWPVLVSLALLSTAASLPIDLSRRERVGRPGEPLAWNRIQSFIEDLKKEDVVQPDSLDNLKEQLDALRKQPTETWYSHSSLEAGDNLREQIEQSLRALALNLDISREALTAMGQLKDSASESTMQSLNEQFEDALKGLELGSLPLNEKLLGQLKEIDPRQLKQLTPEQLKRMVEALKKGAEVCKACLGDGGEGSDNLAALMLMIQEQQGIPGVSRGPGSPPLTLSPERSQVGSQKTEKVASDDLSRALPSEVLGTSKGRHEIDPTKYSGVIEGGTIGSKGAGGEAVWKSDLTPQEREVLRRFFK